MDNIGSLLSDKKVGGGGGKIKIIFQSQRGKADVILLMVVNNQHKNYSNM